MVLFPQITFRHRVSGRKSGNMTVKDAGPGSGRRRKRAEARKFLGIFQGKMGAIREVMQRRNQIGRLTKARMKARIAMREEEKLVEWEKVKMLDKEIARKKRELEELVKRAKEKSGDEPVVKVKIQVTYPGKMERGKKKSFLLKDKHVTKEYLEQMGLPLEIENSVKNIQGQLDSVRVEHKRMIKEANTLLESIQRMDI